MAQSTSTSMLQNSFRHFQIGKYRESMEELQKFKQLKEQSDANQSMVQVNENILLCEYALNRDNSAHILQRLDEIQEENRNNKQQKKKKPEDDTILQYNKAVILYLAGRLRHATQTLKAIQTTDAFLQLRIALLAIEIAFQTLDYPLVAEFYRKLGSEEFTASLFSARKDDSPANLPLTVLLLGSEIPQQDAPPTNFSKDEFNFIVTVIRYRLHTFSASRDNKKLNAALDSAFKQYQQSLDHFQVNPELQQYLKLHSYMMVKHLKAQRNLLHSDQPHNCIRMLNPFDEKNVAINNEIIKRKQHLYQSLTFNNLGCVHAKMGKYALAAMYFQKAIQSFKIPKDCANYDSIILANIKSKYYAIYQNLADALYMDQKYSKAIQIYNQLLEQCAYSQKFWYNRGVCYVKHFHELLPEKQEIHEVVDDIPPRYTYEKAEEGAARRIILQNKEVHSDMDEEEQDQIYKSDQKYESAVYQQSRQSKEMLSNAIRSFRNAIYLHRKERKDEQLKLEGEDLQIQSSPIAESAIVYLCYALLSRGDFCQALQQGREALDTNLSDNNKYTVIQYILEAYIQLNRIKEALTFYQNNMTLTFLNKYQNNQQNPPIRCRNIIGINNTTYTNFSAKTIIHFNLAVIHLHSNNIQQAQASIQSMLAAADININSPNQIIPVPVLNLLIWFNLKTENVANALQLIKRRRLLTGPIGKNKISLLNITK